MQTWSVGCRFPSTFKIPLMTLVHFVPSAIEPLTSSTNMIFCRCTLMIASFWDATRPILMWLGVGSSIVRLGAGAGCTALISTLSSLSSRSLRLTNCFRTRKTAKTSEIMVRMSKAIMALSVVYVSPSERDLAENQFKGQVTYKVSRCPQSLSWTKKATQKETK